MGIICEKYCWITDFLFKVVKLHTYACYFSFLDLKMHLIHSNIENVSFYFIITMGKLICRTLLCSVFSVNETGRCYATPCRTAQILISHPFCEGLCSLKTGLPSLRKIQLLVSIPALVQ
jgi:hypothetical protein